MTPEERAVALMANFAVFDCLDGDDYEAHMIDIRQRFRQAENDKLEEAAKHLEELSDEMRVIANNNPDIAKDARGKALFARCTAAGIRAKKHPA